MAETSDSKTTVLAADGVVSAAPCHLLSVIVDATGAVILYDNASAASGTKLAVLAGPAHHTFAHPVRAINGIYCDLTGNNVTVEWQ